MKRALDIVLALVMLIGLLAGLLALPILLIILCSIAVILMVWWILYVCIRYHRIRKEGSIRG